ncbi:MAG: VWA domain-containing protein [Candidatus Aminicenantes bacterium]|jgi:VWFA-related protein
MKKGVLWLVSLLFGLIFFLPASPEKHRQISQEKHDVEVRLILVDVIVTRDGQFVKDLTLDDFELFEDGKRIPINSFELVSFDSRDLKLPDEEEVKSSLPSKRLAVVFDSINTWQKEIKQGGQKIVDDLVSLVNLGHEVMICQLNKQTGIEILQPFTTNKDLIRSSVARASGSVWKLETIIDSSYQKMTISERQAANTQGQAQAQQVQSAQQQFTDNKEVAKIESAFENTYFEDMQRIEYIHRERERFQKTVGGILASLNMMKDFPGRKALLLISAGIPDLSPPDMFPNLRSGMPGETLEDTYRSYRNRIWGKMDDIQIFDPFNILENKVFDSGEDVLNEMIRFANAHNISIYTLDSSIFVKNLFTGASAEHYQREEMAQLGYREGDSIRKIQNLRWISEDTGADSLRGANKFDEFHQVMNTDLNYYYQLSFYPRRPVADNRYHKIEVKVNQRGLDVRFRKGYMDYSESETNRMLLITAFYNPSLYKDLPFRAELIPFVTKNGQYEPWMNIALPVRQLLEDRFIDYAPKIFNLHVWITSREFGEKGYGGKVNIGLKLSPAFMEFIKNIDYLSYHFKGPAFSFAKRDYKSVFALFDPRTDEIGTWESSISFPDLEKNDKPMVINCILGDVTSNSEKGMKVFSLSSKDGGLEYDLIRFYPKVTDQFKEWEGVSVFLQLHLPDGNPDVKPLFFLAEEEKEKISVKGKLLAEDWLPSLCVWNGIYSIELAKGSLGGHSLFIEFPEDKERTGLRTEKRLTIIR